MNDSEIERHIETLVAEEHELYERADDKPLTDSDRERLEQVNVQLDRYYDLLRQRRARREFGQSPEDTQLRSGKTVEEYLQ